MQDRRARQRLAIEKLETRYLMAGDVDGLDDSLDTPPPTSYSESENQNSYSGASGYGDGPGASGYGDGSGASGYGDGSGASG